ncbi:cohesin complex subunit SCC1 [Rhodotorula toruloides]|uniref:Cohesin complex subunit SCC1 n=1 Tax=Rhodotorula toruloides TaxID=5286 RepID=A0A511KAV2_RHOTO|nr:cohesin complex subunit SCC1 [Rhodotorula toruloides]
MFFNSDLLTKRGALAQVWMASHLTTKLSKSTLSSTSIPKSVQSILGQELLPMALRLSGQLLLGIARIYAKKTRYLLDDAQETLNKVRKAFQNEGRAAVDLPEDSAAGGAEDGHGKRGDINLRKEGGDLEDLLALEFADNEWSLEKHLAAAAKDRGKGKAKNTTADIRDITLDEDFGAYGGALDFGGDDLGLGFGGIDDMGFDPEFQLFGDDEFNAIAGPSGEKRGTKRAHGEDGEERDEDDVSVEQGRRDSVAHASERGSIDPFDFSFNKDAEGDLQMNEGDLGGFDAGFELGFDAPDFNNDFGGGFDEQREKSPTAPSIAGEESLQLTSRAAAEVAARQNEKQPPNKKQKRLAVDKVIELEWQAGRLEGKDRFKDPEYLPASRLHLALLNAPTSAILPKSLPKTSKNATALELFAPPGLLAPELQDLFKMPTRRAQIRLEGRERVKDKDVEQGRRAMSVVSNLSHLRADAGLDVFDADLDHLNRDFGGGEADDLGGFEHGDFQLDLDFPDGNDGQDPLATPAKKKQRTGKAREGTVDDLATPARSVLSALAKDELPTYHSEGPLAVFDDVTANVAASMAGTATPSQSQSQAGVSQSLGTETEALAAGAESVTQKSGSISLQSKNTRKAVRVLKDQVGEDLEQPIEFEKVAKTASRRAAASFFFELLVLGSADVVKLNQPSAYGNIEVRATDKLQEIAV